jgi:hypothetical protein
MLALAVAPVFREQGIHREARRALEVFRRAAKERPTRSCLGQNERAAKPRRFHAAIAIWR